jgi:hypothetical protein
MEGNCTSRLDGGWLYFGVQTRRDVPHIGLTIHVPRPPYEHRPNRPYPINGTIEMLPGARESLSGIATFPTSDLLDGTFILHGRASGRTYTGSLNCGVG